MHISLFFVATMIDCLWGDHHSWHHNFIFVELQ